MMENDNLIEENVDVEMKKLNKPVMKKIGKIVFIVALCILSFFVGFHDGYVTAEHNIYNEILVENGGIMIGDYVTATLPYGTMEGIVTNINTGQGVTLVWLYNETDNSTDFVNILYVDEFQKYRYETAKEMRKTLD